MKFISKYHLGTRWRLRLVKSLLSIDKTHSILDAGCGEGYISYYLSKKAKVVGLDISTKLIKENKKLAHKRLSFIALDLNYLSKKFKNRFDKIICLEVLEHAKNFENIIHNFSKALKKKGILFATIPIFEGHGHFNYDISYVKRIIEKEGFKVLKLNYVQMPFFTKSINNLINYFRKMTGYGMKEVDKFDQTLTFELKKKESLFFKVYKIIFSLLFLLTYLDIKSYRKGKDFILIKTIKEK